MSWLNYHHLLYFRTIAREGSIAKASEKLRVGQPALSAQLRTFEGTLGQELFERTGRRLVLTEAGRVVLSYANQIAELGDELLQVLADGALSKRVTVNVGIQDCLPKKLAVSIVQKMTELFPCRVRIVEGHASALFSELSNHLLDVVISNQMPFAEDIKGLRSRKISTLQISIFGAARFSALHKNFPQSLSGQPLVVPTVHSRTRHECERWFSEQRVNPQIVVEAQDTAVQKSLGASGVGLIAVPDVAVGDLVQTGELKKIGEMAGVYEEVWLCTGERKIPNPVVEVLETVKDLFRGL
ncbi:LysR family transcriptional regulator [bacterium]|nr:LysR family transcriptional regulator [bacterium]